ncbi:hypothetical protein BIFLH665_01044, partial [Bifidobacterium longum subsp. infantis]
VEGRGVRPRGHGRPVRTRRCPVLRADHEASRRHHAVEGPRQRWVEYRGPWSASRSGQGIRRRHARQGTEVRRVLLLGPRLAQGAQHADSRRRGIRAAERGLRPLYVLACDGPHRQIPAVHPVGRYRRAEDLGGGQRFQRGPTVRALLRRGAGWCGQRPLGPDPLGLPHRRIRTGQGAHGQGHVGDDPRHRLLLRLQPDGGRRLLHDRSGGGEVARRRGLHGRQPAARHRPRRRRTHPRTAASVPRGHGRLDGRELAEYP